MAKGLEKTLPMITLLLETSIYSQLTGEHLRAGPTILVQLPSPNLSENMLLF